MWKRFCGWMLRILGWTAVDPKVDDPKAIILGVPHTSVWDFAISYLYYTSVGGKAYVMIKKEFFFWPLGSLLRKLGGVPVDRGKGAAALVRHMIKEFESSSEMHLAIAPEGTRKAVKKWKTGFHTIAKAADVPVYLGYFDWKTKRVGRGQKFELTDNAAEDMARIQAIYEKMNLVGKHPEGYVTH